LNSQAVIIRVVW